MSLTCREIIHQLKHDMDMPIGFKCVYFRTSEEQGAHHWRLRPIVGEPFSDGDIERIREWRTREIDWFNSKSVITYESVRHWLATKIIPTGDTILFMIENVHQVPVGHIGFDHCQPPKCEVSYVMRGELTAPKGLMAAALKTLTDWGHSQLGMSVFTAQVFSDNIKSLNLFYRAGFHATDIIPLTHVIINPERAEWQEVKAGDDRPVGRHILWMLKEVAP